MANVPAVTISKSLLDPTRFDLTQKINDKQNATASKVAKVAYAVLKSVVALFEAIKNIVVAPFYVLQLGGQKIVSLFQKKEETKVPAIEMTSTPEEATATPVVAATSAAPAAVATGTVERVEEEVVSIVASLAEETVAAHNPALEESSDVPVVEEVAEEPALARPASEAPSVITLEDAPVAEEYSDAEMSSSARQPGIAEILTTVFRRQRIRRDMIKKGPELVSELHTTNEVAAEKVEKARLAKIIEKHKPSRVMEIAQKFAGGVKGAAAWTWSKLPVRA